MDSSSNNAETSGQNKSESKDCCGGGSCCSPMQCDWGAISARLKSVLTDPQNVWSGIKAEQKSIKEIYVSYLIPLAGIGALCGIIGPMLFGGTMLGMRSGFFSSLIFAVVSLVVTLGLLLVNAYVYKFIAPYFDGKTDETATFKLLAYGSTASFIGGFLQIFPPLALASILFSIYSLYTIYQGIPTMTGVTSKRLGYFVVCFIASIVVNFVVGGIVFGALGVGAMGTAVMSGTPS